MRDGLYIRLRAVRPEDEAEFVRWGQDEEVRRHYLSRADRVGVEPLGVPIGRGYTAAWVQAVEIAGGDLIGWIELRDISWRRRSAELRVCLGAKHLWGRGLGTEALRVFLGEAFGRWRLDEVYLRVATWNRRAIRAYEKCGFRPVGLLRAGRRAREGCDDLLLMSLRPLRVDGSGGGVIPWEFEGGRRGAT